MFSPKGWSRGQDHAGTEGGGEGLTAFTKWTLSGVIRGWGVEVG